MIISGGFNVYLREVESCLIHHPDIKMAAVVWLPNEDWGESVHAEVILENCAKIAGKELIEYCKDNISRYKASKSISFVTEFPMSSYGKILRRTIKKKYIEKNRKRTS